MDKSLTIGIYPDIYLTTGLYVKHTLVGSVDLRCESGVLCYMLLFSCFLK